MNTRKPSESDQQRELDKLDLYPKREGMNRTDDLLRTLLNTPPDPHTPKPKNRVKRSKRT